MGCQSYYLECQCVECMNRQMTSSAKDARIAELTAEVANYRHALFKIADLIPIGGESVFSFAKHTESIARNALKEG